MISLPGKDGNAIVKLNEIIFCEGDNSYTVFHLRDGTKKMICQTLKKVKTNLSEANFFRLHKRFVVNIDYISKYKNSKPAVVILQNGVRIPVSFRNKKKFAEKIKQYFSLV